MADSHPFLTEPLSLGSYRIRTLAKEDMEDIRVWRNAQLSVLRQNRPLTEEEQQVYFREKVRPTLGKARPPHILVALDLNGERIGYGGLVHIDWEVPRGEVSFLVNPVRVADRSL